MLTRDLTSPTPLFEALTPGQEQDLNLKIHDYLDKIKEIDRMEKNFSSFSTLRHPVEMEEKLKAMKGKYEVAIQNMKDQLKGQSKGLDKIVANVKKSCSDVIELYKRSDRIWTFQSASKVEAFYGKSPIVTPSPDNEVMQLVDHILVKDFGAKAVFSNSIILTRNAGYDTYGDLGDIVKTAYYVFPVNGTAFTQMDQELIEQVQNNEYGYLLDRRRFEALHTLLDKSDTNWEPEDGQSPFRQFVERARISYRSRYDVGGYGGLGDPQHWQTQLAVLKAMIDDGTFSKDLLPFTDPKTYLTKEGVERRFTIKVGTPETVHTTLAHGSYFAFNKKYLDYLYSAFDIRKDYW